jgi:tRNA dimethylallyltransferase
MCGGSMMYVDAVCRGIDDLPTISDEIRAKAMALYHEGGLPLLHETLKRLDPVYFNQVDINNHKRLVHAIEISMQAGVPYSSLRTGGVKQRPFRIIKVAIDYEREVLFDRINRRVDAMIEAGMVEEARRVYPLRHLNSLNTVGYKELFAYFDGQMDYETAVARIGKNTRVYAKKQLTWMKKDPSIHFLNPENALEQVMALVDKQ